MPLCMPTQQKRTHANRVDMPFLCLQLKSEGMGTEIHCSTESNTHKCSEGGSLNASKHKFPSWFVVFSLNGVPEGGVHGGFTSISGNITIKLSEAGSWAIRTYF